MEEVNAPKILYLRAFNVDGDDFGNGNVSALKLLPKEMGIAESLIRLPYHLVAVGKPGYELDIPEIGFDRKYFSNETWQEEVLKLMQESKLILYRPDTTVGVLWEIGKVFELGFREKLVIWVDLGFEDNRSIQQTKYNTFRRKMLEQFSTSLPDYDHFKLYLESDGGNNWKQYYSIKNTKIYKTISQIGIG